MDNLAGAISDTINDQHPISDFIDNAAAENSPPPATEAQKPNAGEKLKRGRGRPPGTTKKTPQPQKSTVWKGLDEVQAAPIPGAVDQPGAAEDNAQRANAALGATMLIQTTGMMIAGSDGEMKRDEFSNVQQNFDRYFLSKGIKDFPPGISLGLALGGYYIRLAATEAARPKISMFSAWVKIKFNAIFRRQKSAPIKAPEKQSE